MLKSRLFTILVCLACSYPVTAQNTIKTSASPPSFGQEKILELDSVCEAITLTRVNLDSALLYADSLKIIGKMIGMEDEGVALAEKHYGVVNRHRGMYAEALENISYYLQYLGTDSSSFHFAEGNYQLGVIYQFMGNYIKSLEAYWKAYNSFYTQGNHLYAAHTLVGIGSIYKRQKQWDQARSTYKKALEILEDLDDQNAVGAALSNLGDVFVGIKDYSRAKDFYRRSLEISIKLNQDHHVADDYDDLGYMFQLQEKYPEALTEHFKALPIRRKNGNPLSTAQTLLNIGATYVKMKSFGNAERYLAEGLQLAAEADVTPVLEDLYKYMSEVYAERSSFEKALEYHHSYVAVKDSLMGRDVEKQLNELQVMYETSEKDNQIALMAKEKELHEQEILRQKAAQKFYIFAFIAALVTGILIYYVYRQRLRNQKSIALKNEELNKERFRNELRELEMKALRAQVNPHFIFNCMNSINQLILSGNTGDASLYLGKLSIMIRLILENSEAPEVMLSSELRLMKAYIELEQLRFKNAIDYRCVVSPQLDPDEIYIPPMILQPFLENAIWHGLNHKKDEERGSILLSVDYSENSLIFKIEDNGVGREHSNRLKKQRTVNQSSMGLKITEDRLRLITHNMSTPIIRFEDLKKPNGVPCGTRVLIELSNYPDIAV